MLAGRSYTQPNWESCTRRSIQCTPRGQAVALSSSTSTRWSPSATDHHGNNRGTVQALTRNMLHAITSQHALRVALSVIMALSNWHAVTDCPFVQQHHCLQQSLLREIVGPNTCADETVKDSLPGRQQPEAPKHSTDCHWHSVWHTSNTESTFKIVTTAWATGKVQA